MWKNPLCFCGHEIVSGWPVKVLNLPTSPAEWGALFCCPGAELIGFVFMWWMSTFFFSLATRHRATVWNFVRGRAHLSLMKPERPYTLSYPLITTQHQCSWGESMWPRLGQSNIPPLDLELKLGHTKELRWGECFLEVTVTLSRFQGGWGTSSETWFPAPSVSYMSCLFTSSPSSSLSVDSYTFLITPLFFFPNSNAADYYNTWGFPGGTSGKEPTCQCRRHKRLGLIPGSGRSPGGGHRNLLQCSCLENPHGQRILVCYSPWSRKELDMTEQLSTAHHGFLCKCKNISSLKKKKKCNTKYN